jgi:hypothetical protein
MKPPRANFDNIFNAFITVFILTVGEDWPGVMFDHTRVYGEMGWFCSIYFVIIIIMGTLIMLSLFTSILLDNFDDETVKFNNKK